MASLLVVPTTTIAGQTPQGETGRMVVGMERAPCARRAQLAKVVGNGIAMAQRFAVASSSWSTPLGTKLTPW